MSDTAPRALLRRLQALMPVRRLFLKIFFWFWVTIWGIVSILALSSYMTGVDVVAPPNMYATVAPILATEAIRAYESGGPQSFKRFSQSNNDKEKQFFLLDGFGKDVLGRKVPEDGLRIAHLAKSGELLMLRNHIAGFRLTSPSGRPYVLLLFLSETPRVVREAVFSRGGLFFVSLLAVVTLLCLWLANHIASPIHDLQSAARRVSRGDLSARVLEGMLTRHDELADLAADFNAMVERIQILVQAHKDLLAAVSHELRSPLTRLSVSLALLRRNSTLESEDLLQRMDRDIGLIDGLMGQLLLLSRFESGIAGMRRERVNLTQLLEQIGGDASFEGGATDKTISLLIADTIYLPEADSQALHSACENIVRNAIRHTYPHTTVEIELALNHDPSRPQATIAIRDRGPGVPEELLHSIFMPFFRVQRNGANPDGNGLGLAIASGAVHLHHGRLSARNRPGGGLEVLIHLPLDDHQPVSQIRS